MTGVSDEFRARLSQPATTLAHAWRVTRTDGWVMGFTDHDEDLRFAGTVFSARTGWTAGEAEAVPGLAAGTHAVDAALSADAICEEDIAAGLFDGATVEVFRVDWQRPDDHLLIDVADFGEITRGDVGISVELRGLAARLDRRHGRYYRRRCDAAFGDARCGVDLTRWTHAGRIVATGDGRVVLEGGEDFDPSAYRDGRLMVGSGPDRAVAAIRKGEDGTLVVDSAQPLPPNWRIGEIARLKAGCDRSFSTCRGRYANGLNFRGFPHIPGADAALAVAKSDGRHDGSAVVP